MKTGDLLFVYGTLRRGARMDIERNFGGVSFVRQDRVFGTLYNIGSFPGVVLNGKVFQPGPAVTGDVFEITDPGVISALDGYEGYPSLFDRSQVFTESGLQPWIYTYPHDVTLKRVVESGDWLNLVSAGNVQ